MPDRRDTARGRAAPTTPPMRPLRLSPKDNAVSANSANVPAAPPLLHTLRQCARRARTTQLPRPENAAADSHARTTPSPPTPSMCPPRRRSCALRQCACCTRTIRLPRPDNAAADRRPRTAPFPPTPAMRLLHKDDTAPAPRECSRRQSREDNAVPARCSIMRRLRSHSRTTPFPPTPPMCPLRKDDTAPAPRECSRRPSPKDNAIPARCSIMRRLRSHSRTTPFLRPPSIRCGGRLCL